MGFKSTTKKVTPQRVIIYLYYSSAVPVNNFIYTSFYLNLAGFQNKFDHATIIVLNM